MRQRNLYASSAFLSLLMAFASVGVAAKERNPVKTSPISKDVKAPSQSKWDEARLTVIFSQNGDGHFTRQVLSDSKNVDTKLPIASLAKWMAAMVVFDAIEDGKLKPDQMIPILPESLSLNSSKFARVGLPKNIHEIPVKEALSQGLQLSSNIMIHNLAFAVAGSSEKFVELMNNKAKSWGMNNTHFVTEHGLPVGDRKSEFTTATDGSIWAEKTISHLDKFRAYINAPLQYWHVQEGENLNKPSAFFHEESAKKELVNLGSIFKTGTIDGCRSLLSITEIEKEKFVVDVHLCAKPLTRFQTAVAGLKNLFTKFTKDIIPTANAAQQSLPPTPPSLH